LHIVLILAIDEENSRVSHVSVGRI
jgi:hypothetical protein